MRLRRKGHFLQSVRFLLGHPSNRGRQFSALRRAAVAQYRGRVLHRDTIALVGTHRFVAVPGTQSFAAVYGNPYDYGPMMVWAQVIAEGDLFVDIGASAGAYTLWALQHGAKCVSVEPDPESLTRLRTNLRINSVAHRVEIVEAALLDHDGWVSLTVGEEARGRVLVDGTSESSRQRVRSRTLDEVLGDRFAAGVKIDVEGAEAAVLRGATRALTQRRLGVLQLEWNDMSQVNYGRGREALGVTLRAHGYELFRVLPQGALRPTTDLEFGPDMFAAASDDARAKLWSLTG